ncbi:DUF4181 domain-containing protein [Paenisporosarcina sp. FSL H8-0542]|uniref:DUF4181 domain-containing protein n=1 Tax=unclassified Paenisporosarcina TaxID=2642018 RepID=UPI00034E49B3|nr:DUF4181 domain-containing protein [Paenisporosarcina sp. HGH0030]EPD52053.1 hypothetical protein HMPREF1210_01406 [Paenisporosarcina sp. HGH0030]
MFLIKLALFVLIVFGLNVVVKLLLKKVLKIEKEKNSFFSYNHINNLHRKIDWGIRITSIITIIITNILVIVENYPNYLLLIPIFCIGLDYPVRAFFERKYSQNPKQYILTLSEGVIMLLAIVIVIQFNLFITQ